MAKICGKWLRYLANGFLNWKMTQRFGKWLKYLRNGLDILGTAEVFEVRHKYVANILNMSSMCCKLLEYLKNGFTMLEMT